MIIVCTRQKNVSELNYSGNSNIIDYSIFMNSLFIEYIHINNDLILSELIKIYVLIFMVYSLSDLPVALADPQSL